METLSTWNGWSKKVQILHVPWTLNMHLEIFKMSTAKIFSRVALKVEHCPRGRRSWFDSNPGTKNMASCLCWIWCSGSTKDCESYSSGSIPGIRPTILTASYYFLMTHTYTVKAFMANCLRWRGQGWWLKYIATWLWRNTSYTDHSLTLGKTFR